MRTVRRSVAFIVLAVTIPGILAAQQVPLDALMRGGRIHYSGGRFERALEQFTAALEQYGGKVDNTAQAEIHIWLGLSQAQLREFSKAAGHFHAALEADTATAAKIRADEQWQYWSWMALINSARASYAENDFENSLAYARDAALINPDKTGAYSLIANAYSALERYEEMLATARDMLALDTSSPEGLGLVGLYFLQKPDSLWQGDMKTQRWDSCAFYYGRAVDIYQLRYDSTVQMLGEQLQSADPARNREVAWQLVEKSRANDQDELKRYIEKDLGAADRLSVMAQLASRLFYAANNLNVSASRAGSATLRASSELEGDAAAEFRSRARGYFEKALEFEPFDYAAMFNLGIVYYQIQEDSLAIATFKHVIEGAVVPLDRLPGPWQDSILDLITPANVAEGYLSLPDPLFGLVDSVLATMGHPSGGFGWVHYPGLRDRTGFTAATRDDAGAVLVSLESPSALENIHLLLGVSQTGLGLMLLDTERQADAEALFNAAIENLLMVTRLNPESAEAWQNLVHCYRETKQQEKAEDAYKKYEKLSQ